MTEVRGEGNKKVKRCVQMRTKSFLMTPKQGELEKKGFIFSREEGFLIVEMPDGWYLKEGENYDGVYDVCQSDGKIAGLYKPAEKSTTMDEAFTPWFQIWL